MIAITGAILLSSAMTPPLICCLPAPAVAMLAAGARIDESPTEAALKDWRYPNSQMMRGGGSGGSNPQAKVMTHQGHYFTEDPIEKVIEYYEQKANVKRGAQGVNAVVGEPGAPQGVIMGIQSDLAERPVKIWALTYHEGTTSDNDTFCVIVSRTNEEKQTHIGITRLQRSTPTP